MPDFPIERRELGAFQEYAQRCALVSVLAATCPLPGPAVYQDMFFIRPFTSPDFCLVTRTCSFASCECFIFCNLVLALAGQVQKAISNRCCKSCMRASRATVCLFCLLVCLFSCLVTCLEVRALFCRQHWYHSPHVTSYLLRLLAAIARFACCRCEQV